MSSPQCSRCPYRIGWTRWIKGFRECESHRLAREIGKRIKESGS